VRVAVMSDVHGFNLALETVLADIADEARRGPIDEVIVAGDLCEVGPGPAEVLDLLRAGPYTVLMGNTDRDLVAAARNGWAGRKIDYALEQIGDEGVAYLAGLAFARRITPPGGTSPDDELLAVHANPHNLDDRLEPEMSERAVREALGETRAAVIAFGHYHVCYTRRLGSTLLADVAAVGNPKDGDLRCKYGLFTWEGEARTWRAELRKLPYPLEATAAQILASGLPNPEKTLRTLEKASY
jgi:3',5'-cyclic AMP phosphodiesterase CpdA